MDIGGNMIGDEAFVVGDGVFVGYNMPRLIPDCNSNKMKII